MQGGAKGRGGIVAAVVVAIAAVAALGTWAGKAWRPKISLPQLAGPACTVRADGEVALDPAQMANAATITAVGVRRKMPERAVVVALATALQESKLENLAGGDRDSVGLFQQRPSQGWGTPEQILDQRYAAGTYYAALRRVKGWEQMRVTDAAQRVQRSAYPEAYQKWADEAEVLAKALLGRATGAVACVVSGDPPVRGSAAATALGATLRLDWGSAASVDGLGGLAVQVASDRAGWRYAHWLVAHAADHGVRQVRYAGLRWTAQEGTWAPITGSEAAGAERVLAEVYSDA